MTGLHPQSRCNFNGLFDEFPKNRSREIIRDNRETKSPIRENLRANSEPCNGSARQVGARCVELASYQARVRGDVVRLTATPDQRMCNPSPGALSRNNLSIPVAQLLGSRGQTPPPIEPPVAGSAGLAPLSPRSTPLTRIPGGLEMVDEHDFLDLEPWIHAPGEFGANADRHLPEERQ